MKLMKVKASFEYLIVVGEGESAERVAQNTAQDAFGDMSSFDLEFRTSPYKHGQVDGWDEDCIPYGADDDKRIKDYL